MSVWVCVPSKRPAEHVKLWAEAWRDMGYRVALWRDHSIFRGEDAWGWMAPRNAEPLEPIMVCEPNYPGYAKATNTLISAVLYNNLDALWCVIGGDDVWPDPTKRAEDIEVECRHYFEDLSGGFAKQETFGVMQPTGDRWQDTPQMRARFGENRGALIDRVAGSAWIGREFALRAYGGNGPLWPEYTHMYADEELQCVAEKLGVFWQRRGLTQRHEHWAREKPGETMGHQANMPEFLKEANSPAHWDKYGAIFKARQAAGFPGHEVKA